MWILNKISFKFKTACFLGRVSGHKKLYRICQILKLNGAGDGTRTRDSLLGRQELYH
jgi:hypothetical protein